MVEAGGGVSPSRPPGWVRGGRQPGRRAAGGSESLTEGRWVPPHNMAGELCWDVMRPPGRVVAPISLAGVCDGRRASHICLHWQV